MRLEADRLERVRECVQGRDWQALSMEEIARAAGLSRMTLHRRKIDKDLLLAQFAERVEGEYREALIAALVDRGAAPARLRLALSALCEVNERYRGLLDALGRASNFVFHESGDGPVMTRVGLTDGIRRIVQDGIAEGSIRDCEPTEFATLLFNATSWTYRHMRSGHNWDAERTREQLVELLVGGALR